MVKMFYVAKLQREMTVWSSFYRYTFQCVHIVMDWFLANMLICHQNKLFCIAANHVVMNLVQVLVDVDTLVRAVVPRAFRGESMLNVRKSVENSLSAVMCKCDVPCSTVCPPCKKPCFMKCEHSACKEKCGDPCSECKEKCTWSCPHARCTKLCGELCDREPCDEPCPKKLKCGHSCVGYCGEPCPPLCRECDKEELTEVFLGNEEDENARFIYLEDCGHSIEREGMEHWLNSSQGARISARTCPRCKTTVRNCRRFGNLIRQHYKDVVTVKMRSFGNQANSKILRDKWITVVNNDQILERVFPLFHARIQTFLVDATGTRNGATKMIPRIIDEFAMRSMDFIADSTTKAAHDLFDLQRNDKLVAPFYAKVVDVYRKILAAMLDRQPLSKQEIHDFNEELDRVDYYKQLMMRRSLPPCTRENARAYPTYTRAKRLVTSTLPFTYQRKQEFKEILTEGRCNECGASIGGGSHRLRSDNQLAAEMDGANRSAWPGN
ncbi:NFX1-type zinc finger-containing protein 1, partial [Orchesella cincta]